MYRTEGPRVTLGHGGYVEHPSPETTVAYFLYRIAPPPEDPHARAPWLLARSPQVAAQEPRPRSLPKSRGLVRSSREIPAAERSGPFQIAIRYRSAGRRHCSARSPQRGRGGARGGMADADKPEAAAGDDGPQQQPAEPRRDPHPAEPEKPPRSSANGVKMYCLPRAGGRAGGRGGGRRGRPRCGSRCGAGGPGLRRVENGPL